jgi:serine/threonine protein kinase
VPQSLAKLIDTVLAQRDFPYDLTASDYKSILEESAQKPCVRPPRVDDVDDDNLLLDEGNSESRDKVLCTEALLISAAAPDLCEDLPHQADAHDASPPISKQEYLSKGTRLFKEFEITSDTPEPDEFGWNRYSARRVQSEAIEQEYTVIQATRHYGACFDRLEQWRRLEHPNIRRMLAMGFHTGDTLVMVFEGPKNASDSWLERMASLRAQNWDGFIGDILDTALGCVRGLSFLHQNRMIHGDVKPSNLCGHGVNIKLNGLWLPENGGFTPAYASPEQFEDRAIDESTDVWNLGVTLVELLLGDRQWSKGPVCSLVYEEHLRIRCKPLPEILWSILRGCLQTDSSKRIRVDQLLELLECNRMEALPEPFEGYTRLNRLSDQSDVWVVRDEDGRNLVLKQFQSKLEAEQATRADKSLDFLYRYGHGTPEGNDLILRCFYRSSKYDYLKYCIMEYCPGGDLETWIQRSGPLPLATALFITEQLLDVLAFLHQGCFSYQYRDGLVYTGPVWHKHIEPKHILLMDDTACPEIRLKGFGDAVPKWDVIKGLNYAHMIPRDFSGFLCRDTVLSSQLYEPAGDVWAVAAVLYYMLTGKVPRNPETEGHGTRFSLEEINNLNVLPIRTRIPDIPVPLAEVIDDALREEPFNRQKAEEFWIKLKSACMNNQ